jgi:hypothetical protein
MSVVRWQKMALLILPKGWHFVCRYTVNLLSVVSSVRVAAIVLQLEVGGF